MVYNPLIHKRKSIRLKGYDYSKSGMYFITICCQGRQHRFGEIVNNEMVFNEYGKIANDEWVTLPGQFQNFELNVFQIMPNHMHGIIVLTDNPVGAPLAGAPIAGAPISGAPIAGAPDMAIAPNNTIIPIQNRTGVNPVPTSHTVGNIVGAYKSLVANKCLKIFKTKNEIMGKLWQRNYYEHIIRNDKSYQRISDYILNNPARWQQDKLFN